MLRSPSVHFAALLVVGMATACHPAAPDVSRSGAEYVLPFPAGDSARLVQGNNGPYGHVDALAFSFDFLMPVGTIVTAARAGHVVAVEGRYVDGNRTPGQENYVFVDHGDGTFSRYYHLTRDGPRVKVGDRVAARDTIGRSGNTGASAGPHLHFDVTARCPEWGCRTVPVRFSDARSDSLLTGRWYRAAR